ncbi:penicillin-binding protein 1C [Neomegalonema perideroedes]|uniref:penicillin-binding protein 1C n=1 Tax=Neomegalonema perideroedes TaxID=217219 RepID=UPI0003739132|nr:penicillin-binding protein 1C [Neomegalonema perideroedes]
MADAAEPTTPRRPSRRAARFILTALASLICAAGLGAGLWGLWLWSAATPAPMARLETGSVEILDREGGRLGAFLSEDDKWRFGAKLDEVDPLFIEILKAYEDKRFDEHGGVDPLALGRALRQMLTSGQVVSGASTLSMQAARLLDPAPRSFANKLIEMKRARLLERQRGKAGVLEIYLGLAPYGGNLEGIKAASWAYLGKSPATLTPAEAALLAAIPKNPNAYRPDRHPAAARRARNLVIDRAEAAGALTAAEAAEARAAEVPRQRRDAGLEAPHAARRALAELAPEARRRGGAFSTAIDPRLQATAQDLARRAAFRSDPSASAAVLLIHRPSAEIRAYVGAAVPDSLRRAGAVDMLRALRSPGSALKPFVYGLAFDRALLLPETILDDRETDFAGYAPRNFDRGYSGQMSAAETLRRSLNVPAVRILDRLGPAAFDGALRTAGAPLTYPLGDGPSLALALGGAGISPYDLGRLYMGFAGEGGVPARLNLLAGATTPEVRTLLTPLAAQRLRDILATAPRPRTAQAARGATTPASFKTGTSYGYRDSWAAGVSGDYVIVVWVGRPDGAPCPGCTGYSVAAPTLLDLAQALPPPDPTLAVAHLADPAMAVGAKLAPHLRRWSSRPTQSLLQPLKKPPEILFPRDQTTLLLPEGKAAPLRSSGGEGAVRWLVNGRPLPSPAERGAPLWLPDGPGTHRLEAVDSRGRSSRAEVLVVRPAPPRRSAAVSEAPPPESPPAAP